MQPDQIGLVVGNHLGFIDIIAAASIRPNLFVTSQEMRNTPFLGLLTEMGGCIYVNRQSRTNILNELGEMIDYLKAGFRAGDNAPMAYVELVDRPRAEADAE